MKTRTFRALIRKVLRSTHPCEWKEISTCIYNPPVEIDGKEVILHIDLRSNSIFPHVGVRYGTDWFDGVVFSPEAGWLLGWYKEQKRADAQEKQRRHLRMMASVAVRHKRLPAMTSVIG